MKIKMQAPSGEIYEFKEPEYIKITMVEGDREIIYWLKQSTKKGGLYLNSQEPKK